MTTALPGTRLKHPAPHRERVSGWLMAVLLFAPAVLWALQLLANYGIASHACFPSVSRLATPAIANTALQLTVVNGAALLLSFAVALAALFVWRLTRMEADGAAQMSIERGEGRTRFLALWALLAGIGFSIAMLFDTVAVGWVPLCTG